VAKWLGKKVKIYICIAPHSKKLTSGALSYGSHSFHTANTPNLLVPRKRLPDGANSSDNSITGLGLAFDLQPVARMFDSRPFHALSCNDPGQVVHTHVPLSPRSSIIWYRRWCFVCGWEGNRRTIGAETGGTRKTCHPIIFIFGEHDIGYVPSNILS